MDAKPLVVLVGDPVPSRADAVATRSFDADQPTEEEIQRLLHWLNQAGYGATVYRTVSAFIAAAPRYRRATEPVIVLPLWRGGASRNRTVAVPAVCEELAIPYVGGDAFVQGIGQDKSLSKLFARRAGFAVPGEWLLPASSDVEGFVPSTRLTAPFVVKPQYSAASIGIDDDSLCFEDGAARGRARALFAAGLGPVLCEEFVPGDEISLCFIEEKGRLVDTCVATYLDRSGRYPYRERLLTFDEKATEDDGCELALWPQPVDPSLWQHAAELVHLLGKVDYMRVDGRLDDGRFVIIELTQDPHLGLNSELVGGFQLAGVEPPVFFDRLIQASLRNQAI